MTNLNLFLKPMLKWAGGKRQLLSEIMPLINGRDSYSSYIEPFLGGGATFFCLQPDKAVINDCNTELMNVYLTVKNNIDELIEELKFHKSMDSDKYFYKIRAWDREENFSQISNVKRAARIIYLNKTCYNGLYRVNSYGEFNSAYGKYKNPNIVNEGLLRAVSDYLNSGDIKIITGDYKEALKFTDKNSFVYLDPPYLPVTSSLIKYTKYGFDYNNHIELKKECDKLSERGIHFLQSNSDCEKIRELYKDYKIKEVMAKRCINCKGEKRGKIKELLIYNY